MKNIETERLIIRRINIDDACDVFEWASDPIVNRFMPYPLHDSIHQAEEWINSLDNKNEFVFVLKSSGKVIGGGSMSYVEEYKAYELGYNLKSQFWGMGYATEASKAMIRWAYESLGVRDFFARHANENYASGDVIKNVDFILKIMERLKNMTGA